MLKVINIDPNFGGTTDFTADNMDISIDTEMYTADATIINTGGGDGYYLLTVPYRFYTEYVDFYMINELTNKEYLFGVEAIDNDNGTMTIEIPHDFQEGDSFEAKIISSEQKKLIWRGRIFSTIQTDLQNYQVNVPNVNGLIKI